MNHVELSTFHFVCVYRTWLLVKANRPEKRAVKATEIRLYVEYQMNGQFDI